MKAAMPLARISVGVVLERRKATSPWLDAVWRPVAVLNGCPDAAPWTVLSDDGEVRSYYAGPSEIELYRSETGNYRDNLVSNRPSVWIALHETGGEPPYEIAAVTADPAEGEALTEPGSALVESVPMPEPIRDVIAAFVSEHHVEDVFAKRKRDRADPETLARRDPVSRRDNERS